MALRAVPDPAFAATFDAMPVALALVDERERYVRVNAAFARLAGMQPTDMVGRPVGTFASVERNVDLRDRWARFLHEGVRGGEIYLADMGGQPRWLEAEGVASVAPGLNLLLLRDVTAPRRVRAVADLLLALAMDLASAPDFRSATTAVLERACRAAALPFGELWIPERTGHGFVRAGTWQAEGGETFPESVEGVVPRRGESLVERAAMRGEPVIAPDLWKGGFVRREAAVAAGLRWGLAAPVLRGEETVAVLVLLGEAPPPVVDETVHVLAAAAAQLGAVFQRKRADELRNLQSAIVDDARTAIVGKLLDGTIISWNRGAQELYGYAPGEVIGKPISILAPPERSGEIAEILERLRHGEVVDPYETVRVRKDGARVRIELSVSPVRDAIGRLRGASAVARDVTRERQLEDELRRTQKMESLGRLAGGVAHDFNNLLTVILADTSALLESNAEMSAESRGEHLEEVLQAAERAAALTKQLLSFARQQAQEPRIVDLNEVIESLERMLRRLLRENVTIESKRAEDLWAVHIDPTHVEQVLVNLAVNAGQAMPNGGRLTLETANVTLDDAYAFRRATVPVGDYVLLTVADTGKGIAPEIQERIFDPFFTTREGEGGSGLGLSTCYGIIRQAGGYIWVYSEPGMGTTFKIYLPRARGSAEGARAQPDTASAHGTETVLLVEDQPDVRTVAERGLRRFGYRVLLASNGEEALKVAEAHAGDIDIVVTDVVMPGMGGRELAERIQRIRPGIPILFTSGYAGDEILRSDVERNHATLLPKPFTAPELARKVRRVLGP